MNYACWEVLKTIDFPQLRINLSHHLRNLFQGLLPDKEPKRLLSLCI